MNRRATIVELDGRPPRAYFGDPMPDPKEGVLVIAFDDGSYRTFNWDWVIEFYQMTEEETTNWIRSRGNDS